MSDYDTGAASNVLDGYTYEGVWEKYNEPLLQRWIWTLGSSQAIYVLGCFGLLITFSQARAWVLMRYFICLHKKTVRLDGDARPDPMKTLSQGAAIMDLNPHLSIVYRNSEHWYGKPSAATIFRKSLPGQIVQSSPYGIAIPYFLSDGAGGAPIVKSKPTTQCLNSSYRGNYKETTIQILRTDAVFQSCRTELDEECGSQYYLQRPQIRKSRSSACPLSANICHNNTQSIEITHSNITPLDVGVNSKSLLTLNHRITCAPVYLEPFQHFCFGSTERTYLSVLSRDLKEEKDCPMYRDESHMQLNTLNGPNSFSNKSSGLCNFWGSETYPNGITVLPYGRLMYMKTWQYPPSTIHEALRNQDGQPFLIIHRAGRIQFRRMVNDPFFAAHQPGRFPEWSFCSDYEATALGCSEQFQYCLSNSGVCTPWGTLSEQNHEKVEGFLSKEAVSKAEFQYLFWSLPYAYSVYDYLQTRIEWHRRVPLTNAIQPNGQTHLGFPDDQWVTEVETWIRKGMVNAIVYTQNGARFHLAHSNYRLGRNEDPAAIDFMRQHSLCDRILFRDANYTNINWIGFWITDFVFAIICIASFTIEGIDKNMRKLWKVALRTRKVLGMKLLLAAKTLKLTARNWTERRRIGVGIREWLFTYWSAAFPGPFMTPPACFITQARHLPTEAAELQHIEHNPTRTDEEIGHQGDVESQEDVDNLI